MSIVINSKTTDTPGPAVPVDCPCCKTAGATAQTFEREERNTLFWIIPFFTTRFVCGSCTQCRKRFRTTLSREQLDRTTPQEFTRQVGGYVPVLGKFFAVVGILFSVLPFLGLILSGIALAITLKRGGGWRTASVIGLVISATFTILLPLLLALAKSPAH